jgi:hypothetical protein
MAYGTAEARQQLLDALAAAIDDLGLALGAIGDAYEQLDHTSAQQLEDALFGPVQSAYGRAQRTHADFADSHGLPRRAFASPSPGAPSRGVKGFLERAVSAVERADGGLARLQDSTMSLEVGDPQLRAGIADVRRQLDAVAGQARQFVRRLGR